MEFSPHCANPYVQELLAILDNCQLETPEVFFMLAHNVIIFSSDSCNIFLSVVIEISILLFLSVITIVVLCLT